MPRKQAQTSRATTKRRKTRGRRGARRESFAKLATLQIQGELGDKANRRKKITMER